MKNLFLILFLLIALVSCNNKKTHESAFVACKDLVEQRLAGELFEMDFPWSDYEHEDGMPNYFTIRSYVEGKNQLGIMVRLKYSAGVYYDETSDKWTLEEFTEL